AYQESEVPLQIAEAVHPRAEVEGAAQEIIRLVREENYRFQDIAVFIRQTDVYHDLIATVFGDHDIPVFIDEKRTMLNHPLIELIRSILDIVEGNWRYDAIFRVLKTGFIPSTDPEFPLTNDEIDELENYVLEYGIRSRKSWAGDQEWEFRRFRGFDQTTQNDTEKKVQQHINHYRYQIAQEIEQLGVPKRLEQMREYYDDHGQLEKGREQEQVWNAVIQLFDEMVEMAGEEKMRLATFRSTLDSGFESLKFAHVPPSIDHVIV